MMETSIIVLIEMSWACKCNVDVQGEMHRFKKFLPLIDYQLDDTSSTGKVSAWHCFYEQFLLFFYQNSSSSSRRSRPSNSSSSSNTNNGSTNITKIKTII